MATAADYVGKNCPHCGAIDSIETDEARGEAACVECATVVAMGLEENVATRFEKEATFADADREDWRDHAGAGAEGGRAKAKNAGLTREEAAAAAAGLLRRPAQASASTDFFDSAKYERTKLHPRLTGALQTLFRLSRRQDDAILQEATALAKGFVGHRRERSSRVEHHTEVAAACLMLAAEHHGKPIPLGEMRVLDPSLRDVEMRRHEIINEGNLRAEVETFEKKNASNLILYYLQLLQVPLVRYEQPCLALFRALCNCEAKGAAAGVPAASDLALLVEAEKVVLAVLLARTEPKLTWANKPVLAGATDPSAEMPLETLYSSFASRAHLQPQRVQKIMRVAEKALPAIVEEFQRLMATPEFATATVRKMGESVEFSSASGVGAPPAASAAAAAVSATAVENDGVKAESGSRMGGAGVKRSRSRSPMQPPAPPH